MNIEFDNNGMLTQEILEKIRGRRTPRDRYYPYAYSIHSAKWRLEQKVDAADEKIADYYFIIYGFAPELLRDGGYRRVKHYDTRDKKEVKCPYCGGEFDWVDKSVKIELRCYTQKNKAAPKSYSTCRKCYGKVDLIYKSA